MDVNHSLDRQHWDFADDQGMPGTGVWSVSVPKSVTIT
jgi:hypothetical protein